MRTITFDEIMMKIRRFRFPKVDCVVGIATGGIVPAAVIAQRLGVAVRLVEINYRDEKNIPRHPQPLLQVALSDMPPAKKILLVDDVSVTGQTLHVAKEMLPGYQIETCVLLGHADHVLFPRIHECVKWPWK